MSLGPISARSLRDSAKRESEAACGNLNVIKSAHTSCNVLTRSSSVLWGAYFMDCRFRARFLCAVSGDIPETLRFLSPPLEEIETLVDDSRSIRSFLLYSSLFSRASKYSTLSMSLCFQREKQFLTRIPRRLKLVAFSLASAIHWDLFLLTLPSSIFASSAAMLSSFPVAAESSGCR